MKTDRMSAIALFAFSWLVGFAPGAWGRTHAQTGAIPVGNQSRGGQIVRPLSPNRGSTPPAAEPPAWCGRVTVPALTSAEAKSLIDRFRARNPGVANDSNDGNQPHINTGGHFIWLSGMIQPPASGGGRPATAASAEQQALELIRNNVDLLGFTVEELKGAKVSTKVAQPGTLLAWEVSLLGLVPRVGFESFPTVAKQIRMQVSIFKSGAMMLSNAGDVLPAFTLCNMSPLAPRSPAVINAVVGQKLGYSGFSGAPVSAGVVTPQDIGSIERTIFVDRANRSVTLTVAYAVTVQRGAMTWTASVDANSGFLLALRPNFVS